jgi:serine phosphatase RsbU (regulator of sigma subunit)
MALQENPAADGSHKHHAMQCMEIWGHNGAADYSADTPGLEVVVYSRPFESAERGGDIHYVTLCASGKLTRTILADVAGHGSEVDGIAQGLRDLLRKNINTFNQKRLVRDLNNQFTQFSDSAGAGAPTRFATAVVATILSRRNILTLCNAGHPRPLFYCAKLGTWRLLSAEREAEGDLPLGLAPEVPYNQFALPFLPGDIVMLYTDGLVEARGADGEMLGEDGLLRLAEGLPVDSLKSASKEFNDRFEAFCAACPVNDDLTMLFLRHTGDISKAYIIPRKLQSYGKLLGLIPI